MKKSGNPYIYYICYSWYKCFAFAFRDTYIAGANVMIDDAEKLGEKIDVLTQIMYCYLERNTHDIGF
jgi:hypothetical protein